MLSAFKLSQDNAVKVTMMADDFSKAIEALIPKSLDDVIRRNRHAAELRLTSEEEIMDLHCQITPGIPKDVMENWCLITLYISEPQIAQVMLLGEVNETTIDRLTSVVLKIDLDRNLLITLSGSLYQLGTKHQGEPEMYQLMTVCAVFHHWGLGKYLGVPHFFY